MTFKKAFTLLLLSTILSSCSSFKRTAVVSALSGALVGGIGGSVFSPNKSDIPKNAFLFSGLGALLGGALAFLLKEEKESANLTPMILDDSPSKGSRESRGYKDYKDPLYEFNGVNLTPTIELKPISKYNIVDKDLPESMRGHVPQRSLIEYYIPQKIINHEGKTIKIEAHKAFEVQ